MGLIIHDEITLKNGLTLRDTYASFFGKAVKVVPGVPVTLPNGPYNPDYVVTGDGYSIWASAQARESNCTPLETIFCEFVASKEDMNTPIHQLCYNYVKTKYNNTEDC